MPRSKEHNKQVAWESGIIQRMGGGSCDSNTSDERK